MASVHEIVDPMPTPPTTRPEVEQALEASASPPTAEEYVRLHRQQGRSWRWIVADISRLTGLETNKTSLIRWFPHLNKPVHELFDN